MAAQRLVVNVENVRSEAGAIHIGFYDSEAQWKTEKSNFQRHATKATLKDDGTLSVSFDDVPPGRYGVAIVDDENNNGHIDWGLFLPKEGFGFSNYEHRGLFRPEYEDFAFDLPAEETVTIVVRVRYL